MNTYYSTCVPGLERIAQRLMQREIPGFQLEKLMSGALIYRAGALDRQLDHLGCLSNTYLLMGQRERVRDLSQAVHWLLSDRKLMGRIDRALALNRFKSFRVMFSEANRLASVRPDQRAQLERMLPSSKVNRLNPETEVLLLWRSEGFALALIRLTRPGEARKQVKQGQLSPAICQCLVALADPKRGQRFLDPFCGHGALGLERLKWGGARQVTMADCNPELVATLKRRLPAPAQALVLDALQLDQHLEPASVDELVTDPPWGLFEPLPLPPEQFYREMLRQFAFVLAPGGRLVVLTADKERFARALREQPGLRFEERFDLLVNGKKAAAFVARRAADGAKAAYAPHP